MYNVKGPSKIVAKSRRGLVQNIEVKNKQTNHPNNCNNNNNNSNNANNNNNINEEIMVKGPKPVFQNLNKKLHQNGACYHEYDDQQVVTPQHEEIVNYVNDSWNCICSELDLHTHSSDGNPRSDHSVYYYEDDPVTNLTDFKPFDLESWWGKRLYTYITNSVNTTTS